MISPFSPPLNEPPATAISIPHREDHRRRQCSSSFSGDRFWWRPIPKEDDGAGEFLLCRSGEGAPSGLSCRGLTNPETATESWSPGIATRELLHGTPAFASAFLPPVRRHCGPTVPNRVIALRSPFPSLRISPECKDRPVTETRCSNQRSQVSPISREERKATGFRRRPQCRIMNSATTDLKLHQELWRELYRVFPATSSRTSSRTSSIHTEVLR